MNFHILRLLSASSPTASQVNPMTSKTSIAGTIDRQEGNAPAFAKLKKLVG